jgi:nicotinate-nucleotide adenylyltransferase
MTLQTSAIAFSGGTYDPVTRDHITVAWMALQHLKKFGVKQMHMVPNRFSPIDKGHPPVDPEIRFRLLEATCDSYPDKLIASRIEIDRPGPSYTLDTLREIKRVYNPERIFFVTGTDAVRGLSKWHGVEEVFDLATFVIAPRGCEVIDEKALAAEVRSGNAPIFLDIPRSNVSSTTIRDWTYAGRDVRTLVPDVVYWGLKYYGLYRPQDSTLPIGEEALGDEGRWALDYFAKPLPNRITSH